MVAIPVLAEGQQTGEGSNQDEEPKGHSIGLAIGHAHTFDGRDENDQRQTLALPCWSLDYNYHFSAQWALGLHTDFILEKFRIESSGGDELTERSYPVAPAIIAMHNISPHWEVQLGPGIEFAKEDNVFLIRAGAEYSVDLPKEWEVFGSLCYDIKWDTYSTLTISMGISKRLKR